MEHTVKTEVILSIVDVVHAASEQEAMDKVRESESNQSYLSDLIKGNDFETVNYTVISKEEG